MLCSVVALGSAVVLSCTSTGYYEAVSPKFACIDSSSTGEQHSTMQGLLELAVIAQPSGLIREARAKGTQTREDIQTPPHRHTIQRAMAMETAGFSPSFHTIIAKSRHPRDLP
ncbi:hypothetical protein LI328DRAFT_160708 [Trichoderma asperelloides]|nr:hypothetical protein LI328DRAFT_160708 [Trichoderma asperelloides]